MKNLMLASTKYLSQGKNTQHIMCTEHHHSHSHSKKEERKTPELIAEEYDYKHLLTANINLIDIIDSGGQVHFDCPPINFNQIESKLIPEEDLVYFKYVSCDKNGKILYNEFE